MEHVVDAVREQGREIMFLSELKFGLGSKNHRAGHADAPDSIRVEAVVL